MNTTIYYAFREVRCSRHVARVVYLDRHVARVASIRSGTENVAERTSLGFQHAIFGTPTSGI
jgi:hypothetical protein